MADTLLTPPDEEARARGLAARYGLEYVDVAHYAPDPEILQSICVLSRVCISGTGSSFEHPSFLMLAAAINMLLNAGHHA